MQKKEWIINLEDTVYFRTSLATLIIYVSTILSDVVKVHRLELARQVIHQIATKSLRIMGSVLFHARSHQMKFGPATKVAQMEGKWCQLVAVIPNLRACVSVDGEEHAAPEVCTIPEFVRLLPI